MIQSLISNHIIYIKKWMSWKMKRRLSVESNSPSYLLHTIPVLLRFSYSIRAKVLVGIILMQIQQYSWFRGEIGTFLLTSPLFGYIPNTGEVYKRHLGLLLSTLNHLFIFQGIHFFIDIIEWACPPQKRSAYNIKRKR